MHHPELVLRIIGAWIRREEREEFGEFVERALERLGRALAEVRVTLAKLRIGPIRALRIGIDDLPEVLPRRDPLLAVQRLGALVEQKLVGERGAGGNAAAG